METRASNDEIQLRATKNLILDTFLLFNKIVTMANLEGEYNFDQNGVGMDYTAPTPRYSVLNDQTLDQGIAYLGQHGYAVFSDVMSADDIRFNKDLLWNFLETIPDKGIRRDDPQTWSSYWYVLPRITLSFMLDGDRFS